jgi:hypothetical protein
MKDGSVVQQYLKRVSCGMILFESAMATQSTIEK